MPILHRKSLAHRTRLLHIIFFAMCCQQPRRRLEILVYSLFIEHLEALMLGWRAKEREEEGRRRGEQRGEEREEGRKKGREEQRRKDMGKTGEEINY